VRTGPTGGLRTETTVRMSGGLLIDCHLLFNCLPCFSNSLKDILLVVTLPEADDRVKTSGLLSMTHWVRLMK